MQAPEKNTSFSTQSRVQERPALSYALPFEAPSLIVITKKFLIDRIVLELDESVSISIGLLIFSVLFCPSDQVLVVELDGGAVSRLVVKFDIQTSGFSGLAQQPTIYGYWPERVEEFPFEETVSPNELPTVQYTLETDEFLTREKLSQRNTIRLGGDAVALAELGSLFLSFGLRNSSGDCVTLECDAGWRGVAPGSQELKLIRI